MDRFIAVLVVIYAILGMAERFRKGTANGLH